MKVAVLPVAALILMQCVRGTAAVDVAGTLPGVSEWKQGEVYVVKGEAAVPKGARLIVRGGAVVKFAPGARLKVDGVLDCRSAEASPVVFTSLKDDAHGGDTNGDGDSSAPAAGDWAGVEINGAGAAINFCSFMFGGAGGAAMLSVNGAASAVDVTNCGFSDSAGAGVEFTEGELHLGPQIVGNAIKNSESGLVLTGDGLSRALVQGNTISGCGTAIVLDGCSPRIVGNNLTDNAGYPMGIVNGAVPICLGNNVADNAHEAVRIGGFARSDLVLGGAQGLGIPYFVDETLVIGSASLRILPGTILKFRAEGDGVAKTMLRVTGFLDASGTPDKPIVFTSGRDDAHGGDTNGDGGASAPADGDWGVVEVVRPGAVVRNCIFLYSGYPALEKKERSTRNQALWSRGGSEHADVSSCTFAVGGK